MEEYKNLLFNPKLTEGDLVKNAGTCLLCRPGLCITNSHGKDHIKKLKHIDGMVLNGCRQDTVFCHVEEKKPSRYHYHCPFCLFSNKQVGRLFLHINRCRSEPTTNQKCSRDQPTSAAAEDTSSEATPDSGEPKHTTSSSTGVHTSAKPSTAPDHTLSPCEICNKRYPPSYLARHKLIHVPKMRPGMLVDSNKKIFLVRKGKSGSAAPLHVQHSTGPGDYKAICHDISCRNALSVALSNDRVSYLCEHLRSTDGAVLSTKEPFDLDLLTTMNFSDQLKEKIVKSIG